MAEYKVKKHLCLRLAKNISTILRIEHTKLATLN